MRVATPADAVLEQHDAPAADSLAARYRAVRGRSVALAATLSPEDAQLQSMDDASPAKWHLAHTSWFFEQFALGADPAYVPLDGAWRYLFNSYYDSVGERHARPRRGLLSRPSLAQVLAHRESVDARMDALLRDPPLPVAHIVSMGLQHEQQHQELLLTDIKHAFWSQPLKPAWRDDLPCPPVARDVPLRWVEGTQGIVEIGAPPWPGSGAFAFDNESPRHRTLLHPHALSNRLVSNGEYRAFIEDGGYREPAHWLSAGWSTVQAQAWRAPLYWDDDLAREFTLGGMRDIDPHAPVCHLSYFEADAFARWAGARLPTEAEWEHAAASAPVAGNFADAGWMHPLGADPGAEGLQQVFGDAWEWTSSAYAPYPGFAPMPGALGEYNGKFMCNQLVLRGGSCASAADHLRASYRNFFQAPDRWQFAGLRLATDRP